MKWILCKLHGIRRHERTCAKCALERSERARLVARLTPGQLLVHDIRAGRYR